MRVKKTDTFIRSMTFWVIFVLEDLDSTGCSYAKICHLRFKKLLLFSVLVYMLLCLVLWLNMLQTLILNSSNCRKIGYMVFIVSRGVMDTQMEESNLKCKTFQEWLLACKHCCFLDACCLWNILSTSELPRNEKEIY